MKYLRLIRFQNLLIVAAVMYCMRYLLIGPILNLYGLELISNEVQFGLMVISVLFITAAASIINDYFDRKADFMNRPNEVLIGKNIDRRFAIILHSAFNIIGVTAGFIVTSMVGHFWYGLVFILISGTFYLYSARFKKKLLTGNIILSLLIGGITFIPWLTEYVFASEFYGSRIPVKIYHHLMLMSLGFSLAGFLLNMIREILKDIIDFRGDYQSGNKTVPIVFGKQAAKNIVSALFTATFAFVLIAWFVYLRNISSIQYPLSSFIYLVALLVVPMIVLAAHTPRLKKKQQIKRVCRILELIMLLGVLFTLIIYLNIQL